MKKLVITCVLGLSLAFTANPVAVLGAEKKAIDPNSTLGGEPFDDWNDSETVIQIPNGAYVKGEVVVFDGNIGSQGTVYNSETDKNAITVSEAKEELSNEKQNENKRTMRAITPSFNRVILRNKAEVKEVFPGTRGWHSMRSVYQSASETGPYLLYSTSYDDSALVGTARQATNSMAGLGVYGYTLARDSSQYFAGANTIYSFFSNNMNFRQTVKVANR